ncbi:DoxX family membrane protein [Rhodobacterales bacterium HKCCE3408]|nr:DoxX family membrane protein [Rhodobacterales bacterium HKCCE3408]
MTKLKQYGLASLYVLPAMAFFAAGIAKIAGVDDIVRPFAVMGLPAAFGIFIGLCEIAGGLGLLIQRTRVPAALGLSAIMLGAVYYHVAYGEPSPVPAVVLLLLLAATVWNERRPKTSAA